MRLLNKEFTERLNNQYLTENVSLFLYSLIRTTRPNSILEVGYGYTSQFIIEAIKDNQEEDFSYMSEDLIHGKIDYNPEITIIDDASQTNDPIVVDELYNNQSVNLVITDFFEYWKTCEKNFDLIWIDFAGGTEYLEILYNIFPHLNPGGYIIFHNTASNAEGKIFLSNLDLLRIKDDSFESMTFVEPHKTNQNSFTVIKKKTHYPTYRLFC